MTSMIFCPNTFELLVPNTTGAELKFEAPATGNTYPGDPKSHQLFSYEPYTGITKYHNTIRAGAFNPVNPRAEIPCGKCGRQITPYQRVDDNKSVSFTCLCGNQWTT